MLPSFSKILCCSVLHCSSHVSAMPMYITSRLIEKWRLFLQGELWVISIGFNNEMWGPQGHLLWGQSYCLVLCTGRQEHQGATSDSWRQQIHPCCCSFAHSSGMNWLVIFLPLFVPRRHEFTHLRIRFLNLFPHRSAKFEMPDDLCYTEEQRWIDESLASLPGGCTEVGADQDWILISDLSLQCSLKWNRNLNSESCAGINISCFKRWCSFWVSLSGSLYFWERDLYIHHRVQDWPGKMNPSLTVSYLFKVPYCLKAYIQSTLFYWNF